MTLKLEGNIKYIGFLITMEIIFKWLLIIFFCWVLVKFMKFGGII